MSIFDELQSSLQEAVQIEPGKAQPSRLTHHEVADVRAIRAKLRQSLARPWEPASTPSKAGKPSAVTRRGSPRRYWLRFRTTPIFSMSLLRTNT